MGLSFRSVCTNGTFVQAAGSKMDGSLVASESVGQGGRGDGVIVVRDLVVRYGPATALDEVSLHVDAGEMVALIGPNGAGKSTLVNTLSGILKPAGGFVNVDGRLAHVPEGRQVFGDLTVEDNLRLGGR